MTRDGFFLHESSYADDGVHIGVGTGIWHFCHELKGSRIGAYCILGQNCMAGPDVTIGDAVNSRTMFRFTPAFEFFQSSKCDYTEMILVTLVATIKRASANRQNRRPANDP
jgi:hypothetical protein